MQNRLRWNKSSSIEPLERRRLMSAYYVDPVTGSDANSGRSPALPWQTLAAVNAHVFRPGDRVLLTGTFSGQSLSLGPDATGVTVDTYTYNVATRKVKVGVPYAAALTDVSGDGIDISASRVTVADLVITADPGAISSGNYSDGIRLLNATATTLTKETINRVSVSGFAYAGLCMQGWNTSTSDSAGFSDVTIENSVFYQNAVSGIFVGTGNDSGNEFASTFPATLYVNSDLTINNCQAYANAGHNPALTLGFSPSNPNNGNGANGGIFISSVSGATVENSTAWNNCYSANGGVGIWAFDAMRVNFQADQSYDNKTANDVDGDGFDFDHGTTESVMQRDYSHGNAGAGFLLTSYGGSSTDAGDTIRYCISDDDAQQYGAGILLYSIAGVALVDEDICDNTVLISGSSPGTPAALAITGDSADSDAMNIINNIFYSTAPSPLVIDDDASPTVRLEGNDYCCAGAPGNFDVEWNGTTYTSLSAWQSASGEEITSIGQAVGSNEDPAFPAETVSDLPISGITNLMLAIQSPLRHGGVTLETHAVRYVRPRPNPPVVVFNVEWSGLGPRDYFNQPADHEMVGAG